MRYLEINKALPLKGSIKVPGSKNSSLGLLAASCLAEEPVHLDNIPDITDVRVMCDIAESLGAKIIRQGRSLIIDAKGITYSRIDPGKSASLRTAYYFIGALLAKHKKVSVGYPGGDNIGTRPIDQHIKGFNALGATITYYNDYYLVEADELIGTDIYFDTITCGATINLMLATVFAKGKTILHNAARDPEIVDIAIFLNKLGAKIYGAGTETIRIEGVTQLGGCSHSVIPDRLVAGTFIIAAGVTGGKITVEEIIPEHLDSCIEKLQEIGMVFEKGDTSITAYPGSYLHSARVRAGMYPLFSSDLQQPLTVLLLKAKGKSIISDKIFPERFKHCEQLKLLGADIAVKNGTASINGNCSLNGAIVNASDIRAGISLILSGLIADGTTYISGIEHIERGYENVVSDFNSLGADIRFCTDADLRGVNECLLKNAMMRY